MVETSGTRTPLRLIREALGLTLDQVAERSGVSKQSISEAERGKGGLSITSLYRVATALNMDVLAGHLAPYVPDEEGQDAQ